LVFTSFLTHTQEQLFKINNKNNLKEGRAVCVHAEESELSLGCANSRQKHPMFLCRNLSGGYHTIPWSHPENFCDRCVIQQPGESCW